MFAVAYHGRSRSLEMPVAATLRSAKKPNGVTAVCRLMLTVINRKRNSLTVKLCAKSQNVGILPTNAENKQLKFLLH